VVVVAAAAVALWCKSVWLLLLLWILDSVISLVQCPVMWLVGHFQSVVFNLKGHSAFNQACDWLYIEAALTFFLFFLQLNTTRITFNTIHGTVYILVRHVEFDECPSVKLDSAVTNTLAPRCTSKEVYLLCSK
jgi:hypothetical protein